MSFADLKLKKQTIEILEKNKFKNPTAIQNEVIPLAAQHKSVIAISNTGSGKTLSFLVPIINDIIKINQFYHSIILTPTREIAKQINEVASTLGKDIGLRTLAIIGGEDEDEQKAKFFKSPHIIIGTPGRIHWLLKKINLFKNLQFLVLDEADKLFEGIYATDLQNIIGNTPETKSLLLFSATMTNSIQALGNLQKEDISILKIGKPQHAPERILQKYILIPEKQKLCGLLILCQNSTAKKIIFCKSCLGVQTINTFLLNLNIDSICLHGDLVQSERNVALASFREKDVCVLVATDIAARGIDIPEVEMIVNYDLPLTSKDYIHRIGRTARGELEGLAINFITQYDIALFQKIENSVGVKMSAHHINKEEILVLLDKVTLAYKSAYDEIKEKSQNSNQNKRKHRKRRR